MPAGFWAGVVEGMGVGVGMGVEAKARRGWTVVKDVGKGFLDEGGGPRDAFRMRVRLVRACVRGRKSKAIIWKVGTVEVKW